MRLSATLHHQTAHSALHRFFFCYTRSYPIQLPLLCYFANPFSLVTWPPSHRVRQVAKRAFIHLYNVEMCLRHSPLDIRNAEHLPPPGPTQISANLQVVSPKASHTEGAGHLPPIGSNRRSLEARMDSEKNASGGPNPNRHRPEEPPQTSLAPQPTLVSMQRQGTFVSFRRQSAAGAHLRGNPRASTQAAAQEGDDVLISARSGMNAFVLAQPRLFGSSVGKEVTSGRRGTNRTAQMQQRMKFKSEFC